MKAMVVTRFGGPEVLQMRETPKRRPAPHQALVRVHATSVNPVDCSIRRGEQAISLPAIVGYDVSGVVEAVGEEVEDFAAGDEVFYMPEICVSDGSYAEYHLVSAAIVARKPATLSHEEVAGIPLAAGTAWEALVKRAAVRLGETVLILGGGDVALFAVQIAVAAGAQVYLSRAGRASAVGRGLGAVRNIEAEEDIARVIQEESADGVVDLVLDTEGGASLSRSIGVIRARGRIVSTAPGAGYAPAEALLRNISHHSVHIAPDRPRLDALRTLLERRLLRPVIDSVLPLWAAARAHARLEVGAVTGKLVLQVVGRA
ncbi:MAG: zinc-binding dehydrogenase [Gemmatimonadales bacterium]|nr:zinc-binding dehydrogenase [Gemmatimonadales bacterium]